MSGGREAQLHLTLTSSRWLMRGIVLAHLLAALAPWFSALSVWGALLLEPLVLWSFWRNWRQYCRRAPSRLDYYRGEWRLDGEPVSLVGELLLTPWLMILQFRGAAGRRPLVLPPDSADPDQLRRLRVILATSDWISAEISEQ